MTTEPEAWDDPSNGYEAVASEFARHREQSIIGIATVQTWARSLPPGASILDLGCGHGAPIAMALMNEGFTIHGVDASPTLADQFRRRFPGAPVACEAVEDSPFFGRTFDAVIAIGLMFLLPDPVQRDLIGKVALALEPDGRFLFSAPKQVCTWADLMTGRESRSLGAEEYKSLLSGAGFALMAEDVDEGNSHYYSARKR